MKGDEYLHVAVGVIKNEAGNVLISLRHKGSHQGGLWEFPGGKVEAEESVERALKRELNEELGISVTQMFPLIKIKHQYTDLNVLLDVWRVTVFLGEAKGCEGQIVKWVAPDELLEYPFPKANLAIISAARLPSEYAILNDGVEADLLADLKLLLSNGIKLIQARIKRLSSFDVAQFIKLAMPLCRQHGAKLLINSAVQGAKELNVDGLHLTSINLMALNARPIGYLWVAASCHNQHELKHAKKIGVDFAVVSPVLATKTHPDAKPLGWDVFKELVDNTEIPVFALGGMQKNQQYIAQSVGAQGIAAISCFLQE